MDRENDTTTGAATLDDEDADGKDWSSSEYYQSLGMTEEATSAHDLSPDDFDE